jgi:hypothetical protein
VIFLLLAQALTHTSSEVNDNVEGISIIIYYTGEESFKFKRSGIINSKGIYQADFDDVRLPKGTYEIVTRPISDNYSRLRASTQFLVDRILFRLMTVAICI